MHKSSSFQVNKSKVIQNSQCAVAAGSTRTLQPSHPYTSKRNTDNGSVKQTNICITSMNSQAEAQMRKHMAYSPFLVAAHSSGQNAVPPLNPYSKFINAPPTTSEYMKLLEMDFSKTGYAQMRSAPIVALDTLDDIYEQESLVMKDLLSILMGQEGLYIRFSFAHSNHVPTSVRHGLNSHNGFEGNPQDLINIHLPDLKINKRMNSSIKQMCKKFLKMGRCISFINSFNEIVLCNEKSFGLYLSGLVKYEIIENFLMNDYYKYIIGTLELEHFKQDRNGYSLRHLEHEMLKLGYFDKVVKIYQIYCDYIELYKQRLSTNLSQLEFSNFVSNTTSNLAKNNSTNEFGSRSKLWMHEDTSISEIPKCGNVIKLVYNTGFDQVVLRKYIQDLNLWCLYGELDDESDEFLISDITKRNRKLNGDLNANSNILNSERLWDIKFNIRKDGLLFDEVFGCDEDLLYKILMTGKFLHVCNLINPSFRKEQRKHQSYHANEQLTGNIGISMDTINNINLLRVQIDELHRRASIQFYNLLEEGYNMTSLLKSFQDFYLLNSFKNLKYFMGISLFELTRYPNELILGKLENNFKETNQKMLLLHQARGEHEPSRNYTLNDFVRLSFDKVNLLDIVHQFHSTESWSSLLNIPNSMDNARSSDLQKKILQDLQKEHEFIQRQYYQGNDDDHRQVITQNNGDSNDTDDVDDVDDVDGGRIVEKKKKKAKFVSMYYLNFEAHVPFPLNIVINKTIVTQYQMIQRKLLLIKYIENLLSEIYYNFNKDPYWQKIILSMDSTNNSGNGTLSCGRILMVFKNLHFKMRSFIKILQDHCYNHVVLGEFDDFTSIFDGKISSNFDNTLNKDFIEISEKLGNKLTSCVLKLWLTNSDLMYLEIKLFDTIFKYCKYLITVKNKLPLVDYSLYLLHTQGSPSLPFATSSTSSTNPHSHLNNDHQDGNQNLKDFYNENNIESILNDDFLTNYKKFSNTFNHLLSAYMIKIRQISNNNLQDINETRDSANNVFDSRHMDVTDNENTSYGSGNPSSLNDISIVLFLNSLNNLVH